MLSLHGVDADEVVGGVSRILATSASRRSASGPGRTVTLVTVGLARLQRILERFQRAEPRPHMGISGLQIGEPRVPPKRCRSRLRL